MVTNKMAIGFWSSKYDDSYLGHAKGLTEEQIKELRELEVGDRLIMYINDDKANEYSPDAKLKVFSKAKGASNE